MSGNDRPARRGGRSLKEMEGILGHERDGKRGRILTRDGLAGGEDIVRGTVANGYEVTRKTAGRPSRTWN